ncbi:MAG: HIT family protein [Gammaproteobacteria bacterium]|nr:HIT family protein [Gammaproteobacteria bacterium]
MPEEKLRCIFCNVDKRNHILTNEDGIVLLDDPVRPGHVLVGGHEHGSGLSDISPDTASSIMRLANRMAKIIVKTTNAEKVYVVAVGDKDKHFHVHLVPKMEEDPKLGPFVFGEKGWVSFMPNEVEAIKVERVTSLLKGES